MCTIPWFLEQIPRLSDRNVFLGQKHLVDFHTVGMALGYVGVESLHHSVVVLGEEKRDGTAGHIVIEGGGSEGPGCQQN